MARLWAALAVLAQIRAGASDDCALADRDSMLSTLSADSTLADEAPSLSMLQVDKASRSPSLGRRGESIQLAQVEVRTTRFRHSAGTRETEGSSPVNCTSYTLPSVKIPLGQAAKPLRSELVVAQYSANLSWAEPFCGETTIYYKGCADGIPPACAAAAVPNMGREAHTYLNHIVSRWDTLAEYTTFMQGAPEEHLDCGLTVADYMRSTDALTYVNNRNIYFFHGNDTFAHLQKYWCKLCPNWDEETDNCDHCHSFINQQAIEMMRLASVSADPNIPNLTPEQFFQTFIDATGAPPGLVHFSFGAQFAVSRDVIKSRPREFYERLRDLNAQFADGYVGYYMEVFWGNIWRTSPYFDGAQRTVGPFCHKTGIIEKQPA